jgi:hypothetical protein
VGLRTQTNEKWTSDAKGAGAGEVEERNPCGAARGAFDISTIAGGAALRLESLPLYETAGLRRCGIV